MPAVLPISRQESVSAPPYAGVLFLVLHRTVRTSGSPFFRKPAGPCPAPSIHLIIAFSERNVSIRSFARHKDFFSDVKTILRSCFSVCRTVDPLHKKTVRVWNTHGSLFCFYFCPNSTLCSRSKFVYNLVDTANKNQQR